MSTFLDRLFSGHSDPPAPTFHALQEPVIVEGQAFDAVYDYGDGAGLGTLQPDGWVQSPGWVEVDGEDRPVVYPPPVGWDRPGAIARTWQE